MVVGVNDDMVCWIITVYAALLAVTIGFERHDQQARPDKEVNLTVVQGETAILPCDVNTDSKDVKVIWMNPIRILVSQDESRFIDDPRMSIERPMIGSWNLHIRSVKYDDRGEYTCTVNTRPMYTTVVRLIVQVSPTIHDYGSSPMMVEVNENEDVVLKCNATGKPIPQVTWYRQDNFGVQRFIKVGSDGEQLVIRNISRHCGGNYKCAAFNGVSPSVERMINVEVFFPPDVRVHARRMGQYRGKETVLDCVITASPQKENYWQKGNRRLDHNDRNVRTDIHEQQKYRTILSLTIRSVEEEDYGKYTCVAKNKLGSSKDTILLYEIFPPTTTTKTTITRAPENRYSTPKYRPNPDIIEIQDNPSGDGTYPYVTNAPIGHGRNMYNKPDKQITGHMGTGYSSGHTHDYPNTLLLVTLMILSTTCHLYN